MMHFPTLMSLRCWRALRHPDWPPDQLALWSRLDLAPAPSPVVARVGALLRWQRHRHRYRDLWLLFGVALFLLLAGFAWSVVILLATLVLGLVFLAAPLLYPLAIALFCAETGAANARHFRRVSDPATLVSHPAGAGGVWWSCVRYTLAKRDLIVNAFFGSVAFIGLMYGAGLFPLAQRTFNTLSIVWEFVSAGAMALFFLFDLMQTSAIGVLLGAVLLATADWRPPATFAVQLAGGILVMQCALYLASALILVSLTAPIAIRLWGILLLNVLVREGIIRLAIRHLRGRRVELDAVSPSRSFSGTAPHVGAHDPV